MREGLKGANQKMRPAMAGENQQPRVLAGRYEVLGLLGEGGMSQVFRGRDTKLGREVAIKIPRPEIARDNESRQRFVREGKSAAKLNHPNIVQVYDSSDDPAEPFLIMELVQGEDLRQRLQNGPLPPAQAVPILIQVLSALACAHQNGVVHRDLSARNVMLDQHGAARVSDFGVAQALGDQTLTRTGEMLGSVSYMSPEQAQGKDSGPATDLYAAGVLLFEMLTGRLPFTGDTPVQVALKHIQEQPPLPSQLNPALPPGLDQVFLRAVAKSPEDRFGSAAEMARALNEGSVNVPGPTVEHTRVRQPAVRPPAPAPAATPSRAPIIVGALAILAVISVLLGMMLMPPPSVVVPDLVGLELTAARQKCEALGLRLEISERRPDAAAHQDTVLEQDPPAGDMKRKGDFVRVVVAEAPERVEVPDLAGKTEPQAVEALEGLGFRVLLEREESPSVPGGRVIRQEPDAGEKVAKGSQVKVVVSTGAGKTAVPSLVGMSRPDAEKVLKSLGMLLVIGGTRQDATAPEDTVLEQLPSPGTLAVKGRKVSVILSAGSSGMTAPDLEGKSLKEAEDMARRAGLKLKVEGPSNPTDSIVFQDPLPGDPLRGSEIVVKTNPSVVVPSLSGLGEDDARSQLEGLGLKVGEVRHINSAAPEGEVVGQEPDSGMEVPPGTSINLYLSDPNATTTPEPVMTPVDPSASPSGAPWVP